MSRATRLTVFLLFLAACGREPMEPGTEPDGLVDSHSAFLETLVAAQVFAELLVTAIEENPVVQSLGAAHHAFSLAGQQLPDVLGTTFVYNPRFATYEGDATRTDAPSGAARFALYSSDGEVIASPLEEIGQVDLVPDPVAADTALTVRGAVRASLVRYSANGFERVWPVDESARDSSRLRAVGVISSGLGEVTFEVSESLSSDELGGDPSIEIDYLAWIPDHGSVHLAHRRYGYMGEDSRGMARIALPPPGDDTTDSIVIETEWSALRCMSCCGDIELNGETAAEWGPGSFTLFGDTVNSDTLRGFWGFVTGICYDGLPSRLTNAVHYLTAPAGFVFLTAATRVGDLEVTTVTTGSNPDPDGYTVTIDESESALRWQSLGPSDTTVVSSIPAGPHEVNLVDVASNCAASVSNPRKIDIAEGELSTLSFQVSCT